MRRTARPTSGLRPGTHERSAPPSQTWSPVPSRPAWHGRHANQSISQSINQSGFFPPLRASVSAVARRRSVARGRRRALRNRLGQAHAPATWPRTRDPARAQGGPPKVRIRFVFFFPSYFSECLKPGLVQGQSPPPSCEILSQSSGTLPPAGMYEPWVYPGAKLRPGVHSVARLGDGWKCLKPGLVQGQSPPPSCEIPSRSAGKLPPGGMYEAAGDSGPERQRVVGRRACGGDPGPQSSWAKSPLSLRGERTRFFRGLIRAIPSPRESASVGLASASVGLLCAWRSPPELRSFGGFLLLPSCVILSQSLGKLFPARIYEPGACLGRETERAADEVRPDSDSLV